MIRGIRKREYFWNFRILIFISRCTWWYATFEREDGPNAHMMAYKIFIFATVYQILAVTTFNPAYVVIICNLFLSDKIDVTFDIFI